MSKKTILIIGAIALLMIIFAIVFAIFKSRNDNSSKNSTEKITLVYWGLWEPESAMKSLIDKYEKDNPNIDIQYVQKPFTQYETNLYTRIQQKATDNTPAPDIVRVNNAWLSKFQQYLSPVPTTVMTPAQFAQTFYPTAVRDLTGSDGNLYGIPLEIDGLALFYNKKLFNAAGISTPPEDWDTFVENAKKLTKNSGDTVTQAGAALGSSKNIVHSADILNLLFLQNGVNIISADNKTVDLSESRAESAMQFYVNFVKEHKTWSIDLATDLETFYSGKLAMMIAPSWRAFDIINSAPNIEFGIAQIPQLPGNTPVNYAMYWAEAVPKTSQYQAQAWKFVKYLSEPAQMKAMFSNSSQIRAFGEPYSRTDLSEDLKSNPYTAAYATMAPSMKAWQMGEQSYVEESLRTAINDIVEGGTSESEALKSAQTRINEKLITVVP